MNQKLGLSTFTFGEVVILFESGVEGREREGKQERVLEIRVLEGTRLWVGDSAGTLPSLHPRLPSKKPFTSIFSPPFSTKKKKGKKKNKHEEESFFSLSSTLQWSLSINRDKQYKQLRFSYRHKPVLKQRWPFTRCYPGKQRVWPHNSNKTSVNLGEAGEVWGARVKVLLNFPSGVRVLFLN